ncbi:MAG TPA: DUF4157 domain-containing protein [Thermoanaerobaculia bacterium]|jgi:hypothetical protein|nr:DUF4157 domain-containing protein [Thermoanaerobaculia bacterium]
MLAPRIRSPRPSAPPDRAGQRAPARPPSAAPNPHWQQLATRPRLQAKLSVGAPNDAYEREADQVADQVMRMPAPAVQRKCAHCEEEEKNLQAKEEPGQVPALSPDAESRIQGLRGGGSPLPDGVRSYFEPRFGHGFGGVRVHTGPEAAETARSIHARAYTVGTDIVFGGGQYAPSTPEGGRLLAHELTHVVQQGGASEQVQRTEIQDCKEDQTGAIKTALADADKDLAESIKELGKRPLTDLAKGALWLAVRSDSEATADKVKENLGDIKKGLADGSVECEQPSDTGYSVLCDKATRAYVLGAGSVHLCMHLWPGLTKQEKVNTLIHEGAHQYLNLVGHLGRMSESCKETYETAGLSSSKRLENPDSYSCGVYYLRHGTDVPGQADAYKGKNVKVVQDPPGDIDLNAEDETSTMFRIEGAPDPSGFQYRWIIKDAKDESYRLKVKTKNGDPFQYGDYLDTFIGAKTRALLKEKGLRKAEVHCRVKVPEVGEIVRKLAVTFTY